MDRTQAKEFIKKQSPKAFLDPDRQNRGFICPFCGNGSGKKGDGIRKIPHSDSWKCFSCDKAADIFDLIGAKFGLTDFKEQVAKAAEIYNVDIEGKSASASPQTRFTSSTPTYRPAVNDVSEYIEKCHKAVCETTFYHDRGISDEMVERFNLGYDAACTENVGIGNTWKAAIIPTSNYSYEIRNTCVEPNDPESGSNKCRKHGSTVLFNGAVLRTEKDKPICVCEGALDAISIIQCGGQAIGLGSASNYKSLLKELDRITPAKPLILALDNDTTAKNTTDKLTSELNSRNIPFLCATGIVGDNYHDPNDRLMKDKNGLEKAIVEAETQCSLIKSPAETAKEEYLKSSVAHSISEFKSMISTSATRPRLSTGFKSIDNVLDGGLYTGLYIIGAISSLGKTTLILQTADNLAKQGKDVLLFSLEQAKFELMGKSISRETFLYCQANGIDSSQAKALVDQLGIARDLDKEISSVKSSDITMTYNEALDYIFTCLKDSDDLELDTIDPRIKGEYQYRDLVVHRSDYLAFNCFISALRDLMSTSCASHFF